MRARARALIERERSSGRSSSRFRVISRNADPTQTPTVLKAGAKMEKGEGETIKGSADRER